MKTLQNAPISELIQYEENIRTALLGADKETRRALEQIRTKVLDALVSRRVQ